MLGGRTGVEKEAQGERNVKQIDDVPLRRRAARITSAAAAELFPTFRPEEGLA